MQLRWLKTREKLRMEKCLGSNKARKAGFQDRRRNYPRNGDDL